MGQAPSQFLQNATHHFIFTYKIILCFQGRLATRGVTVCNDTDRSILGVPSAWQGKKRFKPSYRHFFLLFSPPVHLIPDVRRRTGDGRGFPHPPPPEDRHQPPRQRRRLPGQPGRTLEPRHRHGARAQTGWHRCFVLFCFVFCFFCLFLLASNFLFPSLTQHTTFMWIHRHTMEHEVPLYVLATLIINYYKINNCIYMYIRWRSYYPTVQRIIKLLSDITVGRKTNWVYIGHEKTGNDTVCNGFSCHAMLPDVTLWVLGQLPWTQLPLPTVQFIVLLT